MLTILSDSVPGTENRVVSKTLLGSLSSTGGRNGVLLAEQWGRAQFLLWLTVFSIQLPPDLYVLEWTSRELLNSLSGSGLIQLPAFPFKEDESVFLVLICFLAYYMHTELPCLFHWLCFYVTSLHRFERSIFYPAAKTIFSPYRFLYDGNRCILFYIILDSWRIELLPNYMSWCIP